MSPRPAPFGQDVARKELRDIARWWLQNTLDTRHGGFVGEVDRAGRRIEDANKGVILNSRILWFFSEASLFEDNAACRQAADRAFDYLLAHFDDKDYGGVIWELAADGTPVDRKKQVYAICFCIYALTAYHRLSANPVALGKALDYFHLLETRARDHRHGGYHEAFTQQWQLLGDVRLGETDMVAPRSMNTHLHLLEAYTALHRLVASERTEEALRNVITLFCEHIIDRDNGCLRLFFDERWNSLSRKVSFGHDIEASWLLPEAADALDDPALARQTRTLAERLADNCQRSAIGRGGLVCSEYDPETGQMPQAGVWWVQAEALVGFLNAWMLTGERRFYEACQDTWQYVAGSLLDKEGGEWHAVSGNGDAAGSPQYKAGFWKAPYHNGRAMMQCHARFRAMAGT